jgi:phosphatidylinositol glycan class A protein
LQVKEMYNWHDVARRTEKVYDTAIAAPSHSILERLTIYYGRGAVAGKYFVIVAAINHLMWCLLRMLWPAEAVDEAPDFPSDYYSQTKDKL